MATGSLGTVGSTRRTAKLLIDATGHLVEVDVVDAGEVGRGVERDGGQGGGDAVRRIGVQAVAHRQSPHAGRAAQVDGHRAEHLVDGGPTRGHVASQQLALGVAIPLADREGRHLDQSSRRRRSRRSAPGRVVARERRCRVVPQEPPHLGPERQEDDEPPALGRSDRAGGVHSRDRTVANAPTGDGFVGPLCELGDGVGLEPRSERAGLGVAAARARRTWTAASRPVAVVRTWAFTRPRWIRAWSSGSAAARSGGMAAMSVASSGNAAEMTSSLVSVSTTRPAPAPGAGANSEWPRALRDSGNRRPSGLPDRALVRRRSRLEHGRREGRDRFAPPASRNAPRAVDDIPTRAPSRRARRARGEPMGVGSASRLESWSRVAGGPASERHTGSRDT